MPALAEFSVRKRQPPARHRFRAVIKLLTASLSIYLLLSVALVSSWNDKTRMAELLDGFYRLVRAILREGIILESIAFLLTSLEQESKDISIRDSRRIFLGGEEEEHTFSSFF